MVAVAAAAGALLLLAVLGVVAAQQTQGSETFSPTELRRLTAVVVTVVALPIVVLAATVGRLSASVRDRRLANLRLLGLTPLQTRVVAATEAGLAAFTGVVVGAVGFLLLRPVLAALPIADLSWSAAALRPGLAGWLLAVLGIPAVTVGVASLPHRFDQAATLDRARRRDGRRPSVLRVLPLAVGVALCLMAWGSTADLAMTSTEVALALGGIAVTGLGVVIVVPVFVRLLADLLHRHAPGPAGLIAARRLQAQPAAVVRVVAVLMIGLFLVMGARCVVVAFERTPQYEATARSLEVRQLVILSAGPGRAERVAERARRVDGVRSVVILPTLSGNLGERLRRDELGTETAIVATCADLERMEPGLTGCVDGQVLGNWALYGGDPGARSPITVTTQRGGPGGLADRPTLNISSPEASVRVPGGREAGSYTAQFSVILPPDHPGVRPLLAGAQRQIAVVGAPGRGLGDRLFAADLPVATTFEDYAFYDFTGSLRTIVWTIAAVILGVGLLTFAIAAIDRALTRRREIASLQVLGTSPALLRRSQWLEVALPTGVGCLLAIGAGFFAGSTYLRLDGSTLGGYPWSSGLTLAAVAVAASALLAAVTVLAATHRLSPEQIRAE